MFTQEQYFGEKLFMKLTSVLLILSYTCFAQSHDHRLDRKLTFPNIPGFHTMKCDLHMHTVFSDGTVWPTIRVQEALADGLDAISLTEHLEYQPHKADIPHPDRNRSYQLALDEAKNKNLLIINGSEITRRMPPGHSNAIFITDANKLLIADSMEVFREAKRQGAFVFWNHPNWTSQKKSGIAALTDMHKKLISEKLLDGIEVVNEHTYSDEALQIALDNNLTIMGTSDIHDLIDWEFKLASGGHRPVTLIFATEKTEAGIKNALQNRRTVVFFKDQLIGRQEFLEPLVQTILKTDTAFYIGKTDVLQVMIENKSSCPLILSNHSSFTFHNQGNVLVVPHGETMTIEVKTGSRLNEVTLEFEVMNAVYAPVKYLRLKRNVVVR